MNVNTIRPVRARWAALVASAIVAISVFAAATPASAATSMTGPSNFYCNSSSDTLQMSPVRMWASGGSESVTWANDVYRWNASTRVWYLYGSFRNYNTFNSYGQAVSMTSWIGDGRNPSGSYTNSMLNLRVAPGTYYVISVAAGAKSGATWGTDFGYGYCTVN
ncbi:hypothetical protein RCH16_000468 [Cryobacterium sp. MP_M5]|uniref:hypothetical protein n=1 Tax=unclassified Cryobacterium TaxID=2649013 RepID=UPI0018CAF107|nr:MULTISPECIES: hypothetical protein [unclassified Cryobacterium]MBG6057276.1 hypothetical protein [Cryobacterium sp. MP_M3]MEC5175475.1 hypothetical protein [Cryobacterium sp. MP_M5]